MKFTGLRRQVCSVAIVLWAAGMLEGQVVKIDIPVLRNSDTLEYAFAGGLDAPQFSEADLNGDDVPDLFVFDRAGSVAIPFVYVGPEGTLDYEVDWQVLDSLPGLRLWALMRDFNSDGVADIFTSTSHQGVQGVDVYRGSENGGKLTFQRMTFDLGNFDLLYIEISSGFTPMYVAWGDVPAISDIDGDGDLDILAFEPGGSFVHYFRNTALEQGLGFDTLVYDWDDICWGKFLESEFSEEVYLSSNPNTCATSGIPAVQPRHSGSAMTVFDPDADGDKDMLVGDLASPSLVFLVNGGDNEKAFITSQVTSFPSGTTPVHLEYFVAPFIVDVNHDGLQDVVATSNNSNFSENYDVAWYYENTGEQGAPAFTLRQKNLFVSEMLDYGSIAKPATMDVDGDGLTDILIGTGGYYEGNSRDARLVYLRNTGTATEPAFEVADEDFLGFSAFNSIPTWEFAPDAGDLDSDGDIDLIVGERNGGLFFVENTAGPDAPPVFAEPVYPFADINVGAHSTPCIVDLDGDGLKDLVVGERIGNNDADGKCSNLNYFVNSGIAGEPQFNPDPAEGGNTPCLGRVIFNTQPGLADFSAPEFYRTDEGMKMITGSESGQIRMYNATGDPASAVYDLIDAKYGAIHDGSRTVPELADLDNDGHYELIVGNYRGGLTLYRTDIAEIETSAVNTPGDPERVVTLYPIPAVSQVTVVNPDIPLRDALVVDMLGVWHRLDIFGENVLDVSMLPPGVYALVLQTTDRTFTQKIVVAR